MGAAPTTNNGFGDKNTRSHGEASTLGRLQSHDASTSIAKERESQGGCRIQSVLAALPKRTILMSGRPFIREPR